MQSIKVVSALQGALQHSPIHTLAVTTLSSGCSSPVTIYTSPPPHLFSSWSNCTKIANMLMMTNESSVYFYLLHLVDHTDAYLVAMFAPNVILSYCVVHWFISRGLVWKALYELLRQRLEGNGHLFIWKEVLLSRFKREYGNMSLGFVRWLQENPFTSTRSHWFLMRFIVVNSTYSKVMAPPSVLDFRDKARSHSRQIRGLGIVLCGCWLM